MSSTLDSPNSDDKNKLPDLSNVLTFEGQFDLIAFEQQADKMSREDAIFMLKSLNRQMILQKHVFKGMMRNGI